jgi:hypothetical protein
VLITKRRAVFSTWRSTYSRPLRGYEPRTPNQPPHHVHRHCQKCGPAGLSALWTVMPKILFPQAYVRTKLHHLFCSRNVPTLVGLHYSRGPSSIMFKILQALLVIITLI